MIMHSTTVLWFFFKRHLSTSVCQESLCILCQSAGTFSRRRRRRNFLWLRDLTLARLLGCWSDGLLYYRAAPLQSFHFITWMMASYLARSFSDPCWAGNYGACASISIELLLCAWLHQTHQKMIIMILSSTLQKHASTLNTAIKILCHTAHYTQKEDDLSINVLYASIATKEAMQMGFFPLTRKNFLSGLRAA